jgi:hypothetical protein
MTDTNPPADRTAEIRARLEAADTPGPWEIEPDEHGTRLGSKTRWVGHCPDCGTTAEFDSGDADLIANAPTDLAYLLARVEELGGQLAKARSTAAIDALTTGRRFISDHREQLRKDRSRFDQRFQGRLLGLEEAAGNLTTLIKSLRANEPGIEAGDDEH